MSRHDRPESTAPEGQRCECLVRGKKGNVWYDWQKKDHRCPRRAQQMRGGIAVCYSHSIAKKVERYESKR